MNTLMSQRSMETFVRLQKRLLRSRRLPLIGMALTLLILGGTIYLGTAHVRQKIRGQIAGRDAAILHSVALMQQLSQESDLELGGQLEEVTDQFAILLQISQLNGVIAARLFDAEGKFLVPFPANVAEIKLNAEDLGKLKELKPLSHFEQQANPANVFAPALTSPPRASSAPLLEVTIPLHRKDQTKLLGIIQFVIDGKSIATEYAELDRSLFYQATLVFLAASLLIVAGLSWAFRRLQRTSRLLLERTGHLARANEELALAAKTSAVGAVAAHLIHGLSNPLSGLQDFVAGRGQGTVESEWQDAITTANQMQSLIGEIVRIIGDEHGVERYEVTLHELVEVISAKVQPAARDAGVYFKASVTGEGVLPNREANLALLILDNLLKNALQATPPAKTLRLRIATAGDRIAFEVEDEGPGISAVMKGSIFKPCRSTKPGGNGIGLALCRQLANHLGAELVLRRDTPQGCVFALTLLHPKSEVASSRHQG